MSEDKKEPIAEVEKEEAEMSEKKEQKKKKVTPFHESQFAKVFLSFVILSGAINIVGAFLFDQSSVSGSPDPANAGIGILSFLLGLTAFIMAIVAWVTWRSKDYPKSAIALAVTRVLAPIGLGIISTVAGIFYVKQNFDKFSALEESGTTAADLALEIPFYLTALNWLGIAMSVAFVVWAAYLLAANKEK